MDILKIAQSEDIDAELTILKKDGTPLDMTLAVAIYVVIHNGYNVIVAKFKKGSTTTGWYSMDLTNADDGILKFKILSEVTKLMDEGHYYAEVRVRFSSTQHLDDNVYDVVEPKQYVFTIEESQINKLTSLP